MRRSAPAPRPRHLHSAPARNFRPPSPAHSAFETRPAQIPRGPPRRRPSPHSRNSPPPARYSGHRLPAEVGPSERAAAQPVCCFQRHTRSAAWRAPRQFRTSGKCQLPASSFSAVTRAAIPRVSPVYELFPSREYLRSYHTSLLPLNAFAGPLPRTGERIAPFGVLLNDSTHPGKLLPAVRRYCYLVRESCFIHRSFQAERMILFSPRQVGRAFCAVCCFACLVFTQRAAATLPRQTPSAARDSARQSRESGPPLRIPRQQAQTTAALDGLVRDAGFSNSPLPVPAAVLTLRNVQSDEIFSATTSGEGVFRVFPLPPCHYPLRVEAKDYAPFVLSDLALQPDEVVTLEISLVTVSAMEARSRLPRLPELGPALSAPAQPSFGTYREFRHRLDSDPAYIENISPDALPPVADVYNTVPNRWALEQPDYHRYSQRGDYIYTMPRWYDPFNRNRFKGDSPIWPELVGQQTFLNITASSESFFDGRRVPSPSNVSSARAGSSGFFGKGEQAFFDQTLRFAFDLFHGDAAFKPVGWRIRITPEISLNNLNVRELGLVGPDPRCGSNRFDRHVGLQEAFVEVKVHDLGPNYDFISARAGIQQFNAHFRGFLFVDEPPAVLIFGNLHSDRIEYNVAYFHLLEKNTNSGLNTFIRRHQQILLATVCLQDYFFSVYTPELVTPPTKDTPYLSL